MNLGILIRNAADVSHRKGHKLTNCKAYPGGWRAVCKLCGCHVRLVSSTGHVQGPAFSDNCKTTKGDKCLRK